MKAHILAGRTLDPLVIWGDGKHDGRHRAYAANELGITSVPVIVFGKQIGERVIQHHSPYRKLLYGR